MSTQMQDFKAFWSFVRADRKRTQRFWVLVGVVLLGVAAIILAAVIPAVLLSQGS